MIRITRFLYIHSLIVPMLVLAYLVGSLSTFFMSFGVVMIHELCHLFAAILLGIGVKSIIILPFGMTLRLSQEVVRNPQKEALIAVSGPLANVVMIALSRYMEPSINTMVFVVINWSVLILNLVPVPPLDGGRILRALVIKNAGLMTAAGIVRKISKIFICFVCVLGAVVAVYTRGNPSLMIIGAFLIFSMIEEKKNSDFLIMHALIGEKEKLTNEKLIPTNTLCISVNTPAKAVIRKLNLSTFYIVHILDENHKIIKTATESDFIRAVKSKGFSVLSGDV
ncbi:MAG: hypothetical protein J6R66_00320 [Clostridia bacterium]|nr:hypothetical protein [Clostridia bacterium]